MEPNKFRILKGGKEFEAQRLDELCTELREIVMGSVETSEQQRELRARRADFEGGVLALASVIGVSEKEMTQDFIILCGCNISMTDKAKEAYHEWWETVKDGWIFKGDVGYDDAFLAGVKWSRQTDYALPSVHVEAKRKLKIAVEALEELTGYLGDPLRYRTIAAVALKKIKEADSDESTN